MAPDLMLSARSAFEVLALPLEAELQVQQLLSPRTISLTIIKLTHARAHVISYLASAVT